MTLCAITTASSKQATVVLELVHFGVELASVRAGCCVLQTDCLLVGSVGETDWKLFVADVDDDESTKLRSMRDVGKQRVSHRAHNIHAPECSHV